jgi:voltage-gated potassium channel
VTAPADRNGLPAARRRRIILLGSLRALVTTAVLVTLYYVLPLDHIKNVPVTLTAGLLILTAATVWQLRQISVAKYPALRAIEALATTIPLFLLLFASVYFVMAGSSTANFSTHSLTRTDALYFTVTVFATVGFGDITAASQSARLVVTAQMLLDLLALGLVVRAFVGAVQLARQQGGQGGQGGPPQASELGRRGRCAARGEQPAVEALRDGGGAVADAQLGVDVQQVGLDRGLADEQPCGRLPVGGPRGD